MTHWAETVEKAVQSLATYVVVTMAAGFVWLVRRIFTNQKQLEIMRTEFQAREEMRQRDREDMLELKGDVKALRKDVMSMFQNHGGG